MMARWLQIYIALSCLKARLDLFKENQKVFNFYVLKNAQTQ